MKILLIEDEPTVAQFILNGLTEAGHSCSCESDGRSGLTSALSGGFDVIILDRMLPEMDGMEVLENIKQQQITTPVLFLSAKNKVEDRVTGLRAGADDYLSKPFAFEELLARIEILASRSISENNPTNTEIVVGDLTLDLIERTAKRGDIEIELQSKEFKLLEYLMLNQGKVITRAMLLEKVWEYNFDPQTNVIDVHISRLRNKIDKGFEHNMISTIRGAGYSLTPESQANTD
ncbi:response regulator transcription factor [Glaciecola sp. 1036]|uniref:response regulator transcription factor n=1 Tax=Alteromonadaceae TaxID=72275 RepID=UPI003D055D1C